jgi:quercetin dioxygenase-like cupin family protein
MKIDTNLLEWTAGKVKGFSGKELISSDSASVKLIRIEPFSAYPQHVHPDRTEYAYVLKGKPGFNIDCTRSSGEIGDFFVFPVNQRHSIMNETDQDCVLLIWAIKTPETLNL